MRSVATSGSTDPAAGDKGDGVKERRVFESDTGKYAAFFSESRAEQKNNEFVQKASFRHM
jgi:hypothetical protein